MAARVLSDVPGAPGRLRFAHVLIRDTLYEGLTTARRVRLHRLAVEALEALYGDEPGPHLAELAHHSIAGSDFDKGLRYARRAGDRALALARLRGGRAPVRDGARRARARGRRSDGPLRAAALARGRPRRAGSMAAAGRRSSPPASSREPPAPRALRARGARLRREVRLVARRGRSSARSAARGGVDGARREGVTLRVRLLARLAGALRDQPSRAAGVAEPRGGRDRPRLGDRPRSRTRSTVPSWPLGPEIDAWCRSPTRWPRASRDRRAEHVLEAMTAIGSSRGRRWRRGRHARRHG